ncbi:MAG: transcriptional repressor [Chloroflexi bacterium]|nr:transcriptional repressor [Chloroflexota bacterium]
MSRHSLTVKALKEKGIRLTPQRLLVLSVIAEGNGHMGVDEVFQRSKESYPYLDIATVYRTLHLFKRLGVVTEVGIGDRLHFELTDPGARHHHMVCHTCGGAFDLDPRYLEEFRRTLVRKFSFAPDLDNFAVTGVCGQCQDRRSLPEAGTRQARAAASSNPG